MAESETWWRLDLGDLDFARGELEQIQASLPPASAPLLTRVESGSGPHCHLVIYFPQELGEIALLHGAHPSQPPPAVGR